jgi:drug/metabolite transporter (DMT)-like permease
MLPAILTTILFAVSAASASRTTVLLGSRAANFSRLSLATLWLGLWAYVFGQGTTGPALHWFILSGAVGFGVGDLGLYAAYPRLGARLAVLLSQCLASPLAAVAERMWLGTALNAKQVLCGTITLAGVALALWPDSRTETVRGRRLAGTAFGIVAAIGQAGGAVITRKAYAVSEQVHFDIDGGTAAFQRIIGGISLTIVALLLFQLFKRSKDRTAQPAVRSSRPWRHAWPWVLANSLAGPAIGVACYQWALSVAPTGVVLPIVALTPLAVMPLTFFLDGERPSVQSLIGGVIAVLGAVALTQV